jgi:hypothetical protein
METAKLFVCAVVLFLGVIGLSSESAFAQQGVGTSGSNQVAMEMKDTVVDPGVVAGAVPATSVYWGGRYYRSWGRPYWRPYRYGGYWSVYRGGPRYWWNGYRWICRPTRVLVY